MDKNFKICYLCSEVQKYLSELEGLLANEDKTSIIESKQNIYNIHTKSYNKMQKYKNDIFTKNIINSTLKKDKLEDSLQKSFNEVKKIKSGELEPLSLENLWDIFKEE